MRFASVIILLVLTGCGSVATKKKSLSEQKADLFYSHGTQKLVAKEYTEALDYLIKANAISPWDSRINNNLGMAYFFKKKNNKAMTHLKKALEI
ncbi:MAG: hypothetical protein OXB84_06655, partial [Halobacteriovoraceae bacterium]|nr:hypothetical protein [Halobacteriovoraceae bacterium]